MGRIRRSQHARPLRQGSKPIGAPGGSYRHLLIACSLAVVLAACGPLGTGSQEVAAEGDVSDAASPQVESDVSRDRDDRAETGLEGIWHPDRCVPEAWSQQSEPGEAPVDLSVDVRLEPVVDLDAAIAGAVGPGGVLFLADRAGTIQPLVNGALGEAVIDLSDETTTDAERGLLGLAFSADCSELYVSYTDRGGDTRLDAFAVVHGLPDSGQRRTVLALEQPYANHNGGDVKIGPDGMLYLALGDGGSGGDPLDAGQDRRNLLGSMLRIDPATASPYAVPSDNPFVGVDGAADEIWLYGVRNPWRFTFDREDGAMWLADVGQNTREEVNVIVATQAGANLGWNRMEGTLPFSGEEPADHHPPVYEYATTSSRCAITGGYVYRGRAIPELRGAYVFSDYCEGRLRAIVVDDGQVVAEHDLGVDGGNVVSFAEDAAGELYVLSLDGRVSKLLPG